MADIPYESIRSSELLARASSRLLIVDVQQKLIPHIPVAESLTSNCEKLIRAAGILGVPVSATEQYPQGLGKTVAELSALLPGSADGSIAEKLRFSCAEVLEWGTASADVERYQIVVAGIEAHVCVQQTVLDLLSCGFRLYVVADAVASRKKFDWQIALQRMADAGAVVTTTESVLFEWCEAAGTAEFKQISRLITGR